LGFFAPGAERMILCAATSCLLGAAGAWGVARYGGLAGLLAFSCERSSHVGVIPKGGGIGIAAAVTLAAAVADVPWLLWLPAIVVSLVSFAGDRSDLPPVWRLWIQFACAVPAAVAALAGGAVFPSLPLYPLLVIFIVATANFANFMDGINGMAGMTGLIGFGLLFLRAVSLGEVAVAGIILAPACACLGFLPFNIPKAKVFMGDVGSVLLGFLLATMILRLSSSFAGLAVAAAFFFPLFADTATTILIRMRDQEPLTQAHRRHLYQLLANEGGVAHWKISAGYGLFQACVGLAAWAAEYFGNLALMTVWLAAFALFFAANSRIRRAYDAVPAGEATGQRS
jgi:Fuc2NAc and GlcNAc transferase